MYQTLQINASYRLDLHSYANEINDKTVHTEGKFQL